MPTLELAASAAPGLRAPRDNDEPRPADPERRLEDWLVCQLDPDAFPDPESRPSLEALLASWPKVRSVNPTRSGPAAPARPAGPAWAKLKVSTARDITVVRFRDARLLREDDLRTAAEELSALVRAGHHRIVLNFSGVERMSSQIVGAVARAHRRCAAADGGALRICNLAPELAEVFKLTGLAGPVAMFPDERSALEVPWPAPRGPRPLPVSVIAALKARARHERPTEPVAEDRSVDPGLTGGPNLHLIALSGRGRGRTVDISASPFVLGRDAGCDLRADWPTISRRHAAIEHRDGRAFVRDLDTTNGTFHNDRTLRGESAELNDGDTLQIGPLRFAVTFRRPDEPAAPVPDDLVASWLRGGSDECSDSPETIEFDPASFDGPLKTEVVEDILIVTPLAPNLGDDDAEVDTLRAHLVALIEAPLPRRVVIDLVRVGDLSSRAVGLLLSHALRLEHLGGTLRLAQPAAAVMALLEGLRLPMLVGVFPTLGEAVLASWEEECY